MLKIIYGRSNPPSRVSDAKLLLHDFLASQKAHKLPAGAPITFGDAQRVYEAELEMDHALKELSKRYRRFCLQKLNETWPDLKATKLSRITEGDCKAWASKLAAQVDEQYFNNVLANY